MSFCKPKDWDSCRVEKMGCPGCYFDNDLNRFETPRPPEFHETSAAAYAIEDLKKTAACAEDLMQVVKLRIGSCMHCGTDIHQGESMFCESCYQNLIADNAALQMKLSNQCAPDMSAYCSKREMSLFLQSLYCIAASNQENKEAQILSLISNKLDEIGR